MNCVNCDKETNNPRYCSRSCAAIANNKKYPKRLKEGECKKCGKVIHSNATYCSKECYGICNLFDERVRLTGCYYATDTNSGTKSLRKYLVKKFGNNCMICGQSGDNWNGKPITLIVDHINGHANDWRTSNIQLVCPNCDCQLPTYKGRNKGNSTRKYTITQK